MKSSIGFVFWANGCAIRWKFLSNASSAPFREQLYPAVEEMQEILGGVTDAHVAAEHLVEIREHIKSFHRTAWPRYQKPIEQLLQSRRQLFPQGRKKFLAWAPKWKKLTVDFALGSLLLSG